MEGWIKNTITDKKEYIEIKEDFKKAYERVMREVNQFSTPKQLIAMLNQEHPTLKMCLLRALIRSIRESEIQYDKNGEVKSHDGRIGRDVVKFATEACIPFI